MYNHICESDNHYIELTKLVKKDIPKTVMRALEEDLGGEININNDITVNILPKNSKAYAQIITNEEGIFCGTDWVKEIFKQLHQSVNLTWHVEERQKIKPKQLLIEIEGSSRAIITSERTILNFIQTLSGVATKVSHYVSLINNTNTKLLDTRKTLPGLRTALKHAVICGGGNSHRVGLSDAFLIKENHIIAIGSIQKAIESARSMLPDNTIEVEVESIAELIQAINAGADIIMLDNFDFEKTKQAIKINNKRVPLELSGNINDCLISKLAQIGIDYISIGDFTKNICSLDMSMRLKIK
ncbi:carboxylating nicotinate-nucleotide diphosphorylase [Candidatus Pantoea edessiphila]|uniref:nicotinate-nucleotide diphosphorylase (carboxylating) n=1 Tax=Candidatus Pantoea edessiphila TaxID=2044610 RepID=A0A2P5SW93_9GAMM|nr:carboxylating nicotinate-nucleotide diphosphorylase [Candidatus Pantoea edessiphila]PPI86605.1 nicotinate-nucleotide diphosphorylase [Candidatus Pantoea edessiphila]